MIPDKRSELEARLDELSERLSTIESRLSALEAAPRPAPTLDDDGLRASGPTMPAALADSARRTECLSLIGRTLLVLAGAFLLRALTESGTLPVRAGTLLGLGFAAVWLWMAGRSARAERRASAGFHALSAALIAFPLAWEATTRFALLSRTASATTVVAIAAAGLALAAWRRLEAVAWVFAIGAATTLLALVFTTRSVVLFAPPLLLLALATLWLGYLRGWRGPGWALAALADGWVLLLGVLVLAGDAERVWSLAHPREVVALQLVLVLIYCGSFGARTLARRSEIGGAEIAQATATMIVGLGGALAVSQSTGFGEAALGAVGLLLAAGCYAAAFAFIDRQSPGRRNFIFYTTLALVFAPVALDALLVEPGFSLALSLLALVTAWLGTVRKRATLTLHGAVYVLLAAVGSGLLARSVHSMVGDTLTPAAGLASSASAVLAVALVCAWLPVATHGRTWGGFSRAPKLAVLLVVVLGVDATLVVVGAALLEQVAGPPGAAALAVLRTGVLAASALGLAWIGRFPRFVEARWLIYPLLAVGGAKLLIEDVPVGRAATLVLSFTLYGGALILAPRLARRGAASRN